MLITGMICGILLGFVLQRGRFCVVGAYRDIILSKKFTVFVAIFIAIFIQSVGVFLLENSGIIKVNHEPFFWLATILGGIVFGFGMVLAGGCATGTWYRSGEGLIGSYIALLFYMLGAAMVKFGVLKPINENLKSYQIQDSTIYQSLGVSPLVLIVILFFIVCLLVYRELKKPKLKIARLSAKKTGISHWLFEKSWHPFVSAILVGLIAILAWPLSYATGREFGLGITTPSANIIGFLTAGNIDLIDWGVFLVLGIFIGSFIAAKGSNEFKFRLPDKKTLGQNAFGGLLMGFGASLAGGCTIGNGLVETAIFSYQGWVAMLCFFIGSSIATYVMIIRPSKLALKTKS
ncbi:YeeE/YedE thiosulfate transporter family protein [Helicobacter cappadocius]